MGALPSPPNPFSDQPPVPRRTAPFKPMNAVGPTVRMLRVARDWSQTDLVAKLQRSGWDCSRSWLGKVEARQVLVRDHQLLHLCATLGVKLDELFPTLNPERALQSRPAKSE